MKVHLTAKQRAMNAYNGNSYYNYVITNELTYKETPRNSRILSEEEQEILERLTRPLSRDEEVEQARAQWKREKANR